MKILYFAFVELDVPNACQTNTLGVLRGLSQNQCQVDAVVPRPVYVRPQVTNVRFHYLWPWRFTPVGRKWIKLLSFFVMVFLCMRNKYGAIYVREMMANPTPRICSKLFSIPLYVEINDLILPVLSENGLPSNLISKVRRQQELDFKHATGLIVPSAPMREWIITNYNLSVSKVHLILNGAEASKARMVSQIEARKKMGIPVGSFCLGFVGNIYNRYDFDCILHAVSKSISAVPQLHLLIVGDGPLIDKVKHNVNELELQKKTTFTGYIQPQELGGILPAMDIGLLILTEECSSRYGPITTKLSTYALYHLPVITAGTSLEGYPNELALGLFLVPPNDPQALADMILQLFHDAEGRNSKANLLHDYAIKKLTWSSISKEILTVINQTKSLNG